MKCMNCEKEISEGSKFCPHCGSEVSLSIEETENKQNNVNCQKIVGKELTILGKSYTYAHIAYAVFAMLSLIACVLPYYTISFFGSSSSMNILEAEEGNIILILAIGCLIMFYFKNEFMMMWLAVVEFILSIVMYIGISANAKEVGVGGFSIGCYVMLISTLCLCIIGCYLSIKYKKDKSERSVFMNAMAFRFKIGLVLLAMMFILLIIGVLFG